MSEYKESFQTEDQMSYHERLVIGYFLGSLLGVGYYLKFAFQQYQLGSFELNTIPSIWGTKLLTIMGLQIVATILISILISILHAIKTREEDFSDSDERDQIIELKANRISFTIFGIGFLIGIITLAMGMAPLVMFNLIVFSIFGSGMVGYVIQLRLYKRGF